MLEKENTNGKPFLDVWIDKNQQNLLYSIYCKPTFTGLGRSFFSHCNQEFKVSFLKTMVHRDFNICSN